MNTQLETPILCTRAHAARLLGCSVATVIRLEREGRLFGLRLTDRATGQVYFRLPDILALAKMEEANVE